MKCRIFRDNRFIGICPDYIIGMFLFPLDASVNCVENCQYLLSLVYNSPWNDSEEFYQLFPRK